MFSPTKTKMITGATDLISRRGASATSLRDVVQHSGTPRGSLSHHFPGGKQQMLEEAVQYADAAVAAPLAALLHELGPVHGLDAFIDWWGRILEASNFEAGCPVLAVAIDPGVGSDAQEDARERLRMLVLAAFNGWQTIYADSLAQSGVSKDRSQRLAALVVASVEGTVAMCRAARSCQPLDHVAQELHALLAQALIHPSGPR